MIFNINNKTNQKKCNIILTKKQSYYTITPKYMNVYSPKMKKEEYKHVCCIFINGLRITAEYMCDGAVSVFRNHNFSNIHDS